MRYGSSFFFRLRHYRQHLFNGIDDDGYFIFVEEAGPVVRDGLFRPDDKILSKGMELGKRPWRLRSSGILARKFINAMERFEELDHDNVTDEQRRNRGAQLREEFGSEPMPIFDLYVTEEDREFRFLSSGLTPATWYWIGVRKRDEGDAGLPVYVGAPELPPGPYSPGTLEFIEAVPPYVEYRLRDIFSLVHISDAGFEEATGGEVPPSPDKPHDPLDGEKWQSQLHFDQVPPSIESEA